MTIDSANEPLLPGISSQGYGTNPESIRSYDTSVKYEVKHLIKTSMPVCLTFLLQYFLNAASVFAVGHLGKVELGAISLCSVTVGVMGHAFIIGVATCLDTLAAQAFGRGDYKMVGVHVQRCTVLLFLLAIPISLSWKYSGVLLSIIVEQKDLVMYTQQCLQIFSYGLPGFIIFEVSKHYLQVQGIFHASTYILLFVTPMNLILNYVLVWNKHIGIGLLGAPTAVVISDWTMGILAVLYIVFVDGSKCWTPITKDILKGWGPMVKLAGAGVVMTEAEWLAFDMLTMCCSRLGTTVLAAQSIIGTIAGLAFQLPLAMGIACSTRVGNLIGAGAAKAAATASNAGMRCSAIFGISNAAIMLLFRYKLGEIFTNEKDVVAVVAMTLPFTALLQLGDAFNGLAAGILRGQGRQWIGGMINLLAFYVVMVPLAWNLAFTFDLGLQGMWSGMAIGMAVAASTQYYFVTTSNWEAICENSKLLSESSSDL